MAESSGLPADPVTGIKQMSVVLHEVYRSHTNAGFSPEQAMQLLMEWYRLLLERSIIPNG